jgi:hypothetical protein
MRYGLGKTSESVADLHLAAAERGGLQVCEEPLRRAEQQ